MPPLPSNAAFSKASVLKTLTHQIIPDPSQAQPSFLAKDPLSLLPKCKHRHHFNQIHSHMITSGLIHSPPATSKLVASLASSSASTALLIADRTQGLDTYTWNTIIRGYLEENNPNEALSSYAHLRRKGLQIDSYTLLHTTKACGLVAENLGGEQIHCEIIKMGFLGEIIIMTSLVTMYGLFNDLDSAHRVFDEMPERDLVVWNSLVALYAKRKQAQNALLVLRSMVEENVKPNEVTAVSVLSACSCLRALREGKQVHGFVVKNLINLDVYVYNSLMDMYSKCGCLVVAERLFLRMHVRKNVVSWTTMLNGYSDNNCPEKALDMLKEMECAKIQPDEVTILGVISMCSKSGSLKLGEWIDRYVEENKSNGKNVRISNALIDMHAKCGNIVKACRLFDQLEGKTLVSWTTMIQGLAMHGHGIPALTRFCQMQREGYIPDDILFSSILSGCSHSGLVDEGRTCFRSMIEDYDMRPSLMHYGIMVDLLCRAGLVSEAFQFVQDIPITPDAIMWRVLLAACKNEGNVSVANQIRNHLLELEPKDSGYYVLLSNLSADMGEWNDVEDLRTKMRAKGVNKQDIGYSLIEIN